MKMDEVLVGSGKTWIHLSKDLYIEKESETKFTIVEHGDPSQMRTTAEIDFVWEYKLNHNGEMKRNPFGKMHLNSSGKGRLEFLENMFYGFGERTNVTLGTILQRGERYLKIREALGLKNWDD